METQANKSNTHKEICLNTMSVVTPEPRVNTDLKNTQCNCSVIK